MDTQLSPSASVEPLGNREFVIPVFGEHGSASRRPSRVKFSDDSLRPLRIALAEYARTSGMYDPLDVVVFTKLCLSEAAARVKTLPDDSSEQMLREALRVAAATCGVCHGRSENAVAEATTTARDTNGLVAAGAVSQVAARNANRETIIPLPTSHGRSMPPQLLGELPDVRPTQLWNSLRQFMWRPVGTLLTAMFARSE